MKIKRFILSLVLFTFIFSVQITPLDTFDKLGSQITDLDLLIAAGKLAGIYPVNKYGRSIDVDVHPTDIWDGAIAGDAGDLWLAPTAARIHDLVSGSALDTCGINTLTLTGLPLDTETVNVGTKIYTFQTTLTDVDGNVLIGANASDSIDNLIAAINLAAGAGTTYAASMTAGVESFDAAAGAGDTMSVYDLDSELLATTETLTNGSWNAATVTPGTGARQIIIYGLKTWDLKESYEIISLKGAVNVETLSAYVIIHRMRVLSWGTAGPNAGIISSTAQTDTTVTAQIRALQGQTQMDIYGIPSTQVFYMKNYYANALKGAAGAVVSKTILYNPIPEIITTKFIIKHTDGLSNIHNAGHKFGPYKKFIGPGIIKVNCDSSATNTDVSSGFDGYLVDN